MDEPFHDRKAARSAGYRHAAAVSATLGRIFGALNRATRPPRPAAPPPPTPRSTLLGWRVGFNEDHIAYLFRYTTEERDHKHCVKCHTGAPCVQKVLRFRQLDGDLVVHDVEEELS